MKKDFKNYFELFEKTIGETEMLAKKINRLQNFLETWQFITHL